MIIKIILIEIGIFYLITYLANRLNLFSDLIESQTHKKLIGNNKNLKITGGIFIFLSIAFFLKQQNIIIFFSSLILFTGLLSDNRIINNPLPRFIVQLIFLTTFIVSQEVFIDTIRISFIDELLKYELFSIFFSIFCFMVLINGTNFLDGVNILVSGYYLLISCIIFYLGYNLKIIVDLDIFLILIICLSIFIFFNIMGKTILGDGGSYLIGFLYGYFMIKIINDNQTMSPYFVALVFWYPAFENLFSILRRIFFSKKNISKPDTFHLHQLIYLSFKKKNLLEIKNINNLTGSLIVFFNLIIFLISINYYQNTKILVSLMVFNVTIYLILYFNLKELIFKKK